MTTIEHKDYTKVDKLYTTLQHLSDARQSMKYDKSVMVDLTDKAIEEVENALRNAYKEVDNRLETWSKLLHKYYKMTGYMKKEYGEYKFTKYIYPYRTISTNSTLWLLEVDPENDYHGGVNDKNYTVDENWNYDITLEEVPEAEFNAAAVSSVKHVIERRMSRIEFERNEVVN